MPVYWETLDGELDSAYIRKRWRPIRKVDAYPLYAEVLQYDRELRNDVYISNMKWMRHGNSVLIRRIEEDGQVMYLQLLYEGQVSLYQDIKGGDYYFEYDEELRLLEKSDPRNSVLELALGSCTNRGIPRLVGDRESALAVVRKINDCLNTPGYRWLPRQFTRRFKLGVGYDWMTPEEKRKSGYFRNIRSWERYALEMPNVSLTVNYTPWLASPWFTTDLQVRAIHFNRQETVSFIDFPGLRRESLGITNLYLYPGVHLQGSTSVLQPYFGLGLAIALPIRFRYQMDFADPALTHPGYPIKEELRQGQNLQVGAYSTLGLNLRLMNRILVGVGMRVEWLNQDWQHFDRAIEQSRRLLPYVSQLAPFQWRLVQLQVAYAWK